MDTRYKLRAGKICIIVFQEKLPRFLVKCAFGIRINEEALDCHKDVRNAVRRLPILLQRVYTNLARRRDVWVEDLGCKPAYGDAI
jgi:hypothetical protein